MVICGGNVIFRNLCVIKYNMLKFNNCLAYFKFVWSQLNNTFFFGQTEVMAVVGAWNPLQKYWLTLSMFIKLLLVCMYT